MFIEAAMLTWPTFLLTCTLTLGLIPVAERLGLVDKPCQSKRHQFPTPVIGGIAMLLAVLASLMVTNPALPSTNAYLAGALLLVAVGVHDDMKPIDYRIRLLAQSAAAAIMAIWGNVRIDSLGNLVGLGEIALGPFAIPFTIFAVVGLINAVNMLDGLDGLAGSVMAAILCPVAAYALLHGLEGIAQISFILLAGVLAFLLFNYRFPWRASARTFMGDTGSCFLGYSLAWIVIMLAEQESSGIPPIAVLWLVAFPVVDTLLTMWRRWRKGQSPFHPGHDHVHFVLERAGFSVNATVVIIAAVSAVCTLLGLLASIQGWPEPLLTGLLLLFTGLHALILARATRVTRLLRRFRTQ